MTNMENKGQEERSGMMIGGLIVLGIGILFLLINLGIIPGFKVIWPIIMIIVGLALIIGSFSNRKKDQFPG